MQGYRKKLQADKPRRETRKKNILRATQIAKALFADKKYEKISPCH